MQDKVYKTKVRNIEELRERIVNAWDECDQRVVDAAVISGVLVLKLVLNPMADILNTHYRSIIFQNKVILGILKIDDYLPVSLIIM